MNAKLQRPRLIVLSLTLVIGASLIAASAASAQVRINGQSTTVSLSSKVTTKLATKKVGVSLIAPGVGTGAAPTFPVTAGLIDPATGVGSYKLRGGLRFTKGSKSINITNLTIVLGGGFVTASVGGSTMTILSASRGKVTRAGFNTDVSGIGLALTPAAAAALNKALGLRKKKAKAFSGGSFGSAAITSVTKQLQINSGGEMRSTTNAGAGSRLAEVGVTMSAIRPAKSANGEIIYPSTGGILATGSLKGNISFGGGIQFKKGNKVLKLKALVVKIGGSYTVKARHLNKNIVLFELDRSAMTKEVDPLTRHIVLRNVNETLSSAAARTLNIAFSTKQFLRGDNLGKVAIDVRAR